MNLLYCIPSLNNPGGMERVLTEKVNYLSEKYGYKITIVTTELLGNVPFFSINSDIEILSLEIDYNSHFDNNLFVKTIKHFSKIRSHKRRLIEIIDDKKIDVCISLCGKEIEFLSKLDRPCKKIAEIHFAMNNRKQFLLARRKGFIWSSIGDLRLYQLIKSVKGLDKLIVLTEKDLEQWKSHTKNVMKINNPNFLVVDEKAQLQAKRIISIGKLDEQKGFDMLIDAWSLVADKVNDWKLIVYGDGHLLNRLRNQINDLHLKDKVILGGTTNDVKHELLNSSLYVMSSRFEGMPMVLIEAMACGLPLVSFECEFGPSEVIENGVNGFLVEPNNLQEMANKILELLTDDDKRIKMGTNSFKNINKFDKDKIMAEWNSLLKSLFIN